MVNVLTADKIDETVKRFLGDLEVSSEASMIEINGRRVYVVVRPANEESEAPWTDDKAKRRHQLIDIKLEGVLPPHEMVELAELNEQFSRHLDHVAPLPIAYARDLLDKLTSQANGTP